MTAFEQRGAPLSAKLDRRHMPIAEGKSVIRGSCMEGSMAAAFILTDSPMGDNRSGFSVSFGRLPLFEVVYRNLGEASAHRAGLDAALKDLTFALGGAVEIRQGIRIVRAD
jgi:hypothetical protein